MKEDEEEEEKEEEEEDGWSIWAQTEEALPTPLARMYRVFRRSFNSS
jgi:hypothetical protein